MAPATTPYHAWTHRIAVITAVAVFPLVFIGAGVTSKDAGMVYRDGFYSDGHFLNPPNWWSLEGTRWEHGHRLLGRAVGILAIALAVVSFRPGGAARAMGMTTLLAIVAQGLLGYFRVEQISTKLAMVHGIGGQVCFCLAAATALMTSFRFVDRSEAVVIRAGGFLRKLAFVCAGAVGLQMVTGAATRHFPSDPALAMHVLMAIAVTFLVGWVVMWVNGQFSAATTLGMLGRVTTVAMALQLFLGGASFLVVTLGAIHGSVAQWLIPTMHTAVGACLLAACLLLYLTGQRMIRGQEETDSPIGEAVAAG